MDTGDKWVEIFPRTQELAQQLFTFLRDQDPRPTVGVTALMVATGHMAQTMGMPFSVLVDGLAAIYRDSADRDWKDSGESTH